MVNEDFLQVHMKLVLNLLVYHAPNEVPSYHFLYGFHKQNFVVRQLFRIWESLLDLLLADSVKGSTNLFGTELDRIELQDVGKEIIEVKAHVNNDRGQLLHKR